MPTRLSADERRAQLERIAGRMFADSGYHGVSMEQLADAAGVSKPVLYQHFPSKRELYLALVRDAVQEMETQVRAALEGTSDNRARVEGAVAAYFGFVGDPRFRLIFSVERSDVEVHAEVAAAHMRVTETVAGLISEDAGLDRASALFLAAALRGLAADGARWWSAHFDVSREQAARLAAQLAWRGLGSFGPRPE
ncbi:MAG TPA: TetR/AcrR family transcriptional regulator [Euzebyales bacterium]|nr:TetR/AcrR family transcriptional regulator [Euzebyales bacterium]